jgi:hypothetical protein
MSGSAPIIAPGRSCASCTLCCKIMGIKELAKPRNQECPNCDVGNGCNIYLTRPQSCREFNCLYLLDETLGPHWRPADAHMVLTHYQASRLCVHVDPAHPDVWRKEPYYADLRRWARVAAQSRAMIAVYVGDHLTIVLPDRDKVMGLTSEDQLLRFVTRATPRGVEYDVEFIDRRTAPG